MRWPIALVALTLVVGCGEEDTVEPSIADLHSFEEGAPPPAEKPSLALGDELNVGADAQLAGQASISLRRGQVALLWFEKQAGAHYTVGLSRPTGDLDIYGYWARDINPSAGRVQYRSIHGGLAEDQIDFLASQDGPYYVLIHAYEGGDATLQLYVTPPRAGRAAVDEVGWPVFWGDDDASDGELVGGGYRYLGPATCQGGTRVYHPGFDFNHAQDNRSAVTAVAAGLVVESRYVGGYGNAVLVEHTLSTGLRFRSLYAHLAERHVVAGDAVTKGETIGLLGTSGASTGPHLHFEIRVGEAATKGLTGSYPCGWTEAQTAAAFPHPGDFIREH